MGYETGQKDSLANLLKMQILFAQFLGQDVTDPKLLEGSIKGLVCEAAEVLNEGNNNRPWHKDGGPEAIKEELTDTLLYLLTIFVCLQMDYQEIVERCERKYGRNVERVLKARDGKI
jgi:NTP pyrophosphatase (non-canonical NTP hydrolase)